MKGEIELYNISFLILKVELHFKVSQHREMLGCSKNYMNTVDNYLIFAYLIQLNYSSLSMYTFS